MKFLITPFLFFCCLGITAGLFAQTPDETTSNATESSESKPPTSQTPATLDVTADNSQWIDVEPSSAAAKFQMPSKPRYIERNFSPVENEPPIKVHVHLCSFNAGSGAFVFSYHDLNSAPTTQKEVDDTLNGSVIGSIANVAGKPLSQQTIRYRTNPGRAFTYLFAQNEQIFKVSARTFLVGKRQYQISALMIEKDFDEQISAAYLDTFRILEPESATETDSETKTPNETSVDQAASTTAERENEAAADTRETPAEPLPEQDDSSGSN